MKTNKDVNVEEVNRSAEAAWNANPGIRAEFGGKKELFFQYKLWVAQGVPGAATAQSIGPITRQHIADEATTAYAAAFRSGDEAEKKRTSALYDATYATRIAASARK